MFAKTYVFSNFVRNMREQCIIIARDSTKRAKITRKKQSTRQILSGFCMFVVVICIMSIILERKYSISNNNNKILGVT